MQASLWLSTWIAGGFARRYVFESLEIFTEYQFERAYAALEKIVDTQRGQTVRQFSTFLPCVFVTV